MTDDQEAATFGRYRKEVLKADMSPAMPAAYDFRLDFLLSGFGWCKMPAFAVAFTSTAYT